jgi:hypothetical protein
MVAQEDMHYKVKPLPFNGRTVPILLQDINGPCPLLAIANILLLQDHISLPPGVGEVSQDRLVALVAQYVLDINPIDRPGLSEEFKANLQHSIEEAINLLPKLTTGIDINVKFDTIHSFEFTEETAIFDLLRMELVHGWLYDLQDDATAAAIGSKSYNELVIDLVTVLGDIATPKHSGGGVQQQQHQQQQGSDTVAVPPKRPLNLIDADMLATALKQALDINNNEEEEGQGAATSSHTKPPVQLRLQQQHSTPSRSSSPNKEEATTPSASSLCSPTDSAISRLVSDVIREQFKTGMTPSAKSNSTTTSSSQQQQQQGDQEEESEVTGASLSLPPGSMSTSSSSAALITNNNNNNNTIPPLTPPNTNANPSSANLEQQISSSSQQESPSQQPQEESPNTKIQKSLIIKEFLDATSSQLTHAGVVGLHEGLKSGQLAVLFRNNHFSVVYKHPSDGRLFLLMTDQGYLWESDVAWESFATVDGDNQLLRPDFSPFQPHSNSGGGREDSGGGGRPVAAAAPSGTTAGAGIEGGHAADSDFALALQLQQEEEGNARREEEAQMQRRQRLQQDEVERQRRREQQAAAEEAKRKKKSSTDCSIM